MDLQTELLIDVKDVVCGDPSCAPIDTVITLVWNNGGRGMFGIPLDPIEITQQDVTEYMPVYSCRYCQFRLLLINSYFIII